MRAGREENSQPPTTIADPPVSIELSLSFGHNRNDGRPPVSTEQMDTFLAGHCDWEAYTITEAQGVWRGVRERATIVSVICDGCDLQSYLTDAKAMASAYCEIFAQECVMITHRQATVDFHPH
jgi:hypothetical protein